MQIFATGLGLNSELYTMWKLTVDPNSSWSGVASLGNPGQPLNAVFPVAVGYLSEARMQVFVAASDGHLYSRWKLTFDPNSAWSNWSDLGNPGGPLYGPSVGYLPDGRMQVFARVDPDAVYSIWKLTTDPNSAWSGWGNLGGPGNKSQAYGNTVAVGHLPDYRMEIFIVGHDLEPQANVKVYALSKLTTDPNSAWGNWTELGSPGAGLYAGDISVAYLPDGRMQIFICTADGNVYTMWKLTTNPNSGWSSWSSLGNIGTGIGSVYFAGVSVGVLSDSRLQIFVMGTDGNVYSKWKLTTDPNSGWSGWTSLGSPGSAFFPGYVSGIAVGYLDDGRMQIFLMGRDGKIYTIWKLTSDPKSGWSQWATLASAGPAYSIAQITFGVTVGYLSS